MVNVVRYCALVAPLTTLKAIASARETARGGGCGPLGGLWPGPLLSCDWVCAWAATGVFANLSAGLGVVRINHQRDLQRGTIHFLPRRSRCVVMGLLRF